VCSGFALLGPCQCEPLNVVTASSPARKPTTGTAADISEVSACLVTIEKADAGLRSCFIMPELHTTWLAAHGDTSQAVIDSCEERAAEPPAHKFGRRLAKDSTHSSTNKCASSVASVPLERH